MWARNSLQNCKTVKGTAWPFTFKIFKKHDKLSYHKKCQKTNCMLLTAEATPFATYKKIMKCLITWKTLFNTLRTGDADLRFYIKTVRDGWRKSAFLTRACFPCTIHLIMQYIEPVSKWSCWWMFIETWPHSELTFRHRASSIQGQAFRCSPENAFYIFNQQIYFIIWYLIDGASLI